MKSPFKFLDSYTKDDLEIFFGREREIEELYHRVFESKIMLVYGVSGTGKSSLIHCGLANKFQETDWLPIVIRRGSNIIESLAAGVRTASITAQPNKLISPADFKKGVRSLYLDYYKPVFFIFDQFEELFIFGDKEERRAFIHIVKSLIESDLQCRMIFVMREEYMAGITEFEKFIPTIFLNRVRIEKMSHRNALEAIKGPCKIFNINLQEGLAESLLEKLSPGSEDVELTYLQVFLDKIFRLAQIDKGSAKETGQLTFTIPLLEKVGNVSDLLGSFLNEQISFLKNPERGLAVLKSFVSVKGSRKQMFLEEVSEYAQTLGQSIKEQELKDLLQTFVNLRILHDKDQNGKYELRHDALATKIYEKITLVEKEILEIRQFIENAFNSYQKRGVLISAEDLNYIAPYESRLYRSKEFSAFIDKSRNTLIQAKRRRINIAIAATIALVLILSGFTFLAIRERNMAVFKEKQAIASNFNYLAKETVTTDPALALRIAEHAVKLDSSNKAITSNLFRTYYDNCFYKKYKLNNSYICFSISYKKGLVLSSYYNTSAALYDITGKIIQIFVGHSLRINCASISADGKQILTGSDDYTAKLWDLNGNVIQTFKGHTGSINSVIFSPDGKNILTSSQDSTLRYWDLNGGTIRIYKTNSDFIPSLAFSPDGKYIIYASKNEVRLIDLNGRLVRVFTGHNDYINDIRLSPDGKYVLTGSQDKTARLWDTKGKEICAFNGSETGITSVNWSNDGRYVLTGSDDGMIRLFNPDGYLLQTFKGQKGRINSLAISDDNKTIISLSDNGSLFEWYIFYNPIKTYESNEEIIRSLSFSPDGKYFISCSENQDPHIWDISGNLIQILKGHTKFVRSACFSPDGKKILTGSRDKTAILWDLNGKAISVFKGHNHGILSVAFSPDGQRIVTGSSDSTARVYNINGDLLHVLKVNGSVLNVAFSTDNKYILTGSFEGNNPVILWDNDGEIIREFEWEKSNVYCATISADEKYILASQTDGTIRLWNINGNLEQVIATKNAIGAVAFAPDSKSFVTGFANEAKQWNVDGNIKQVFKGFTGFIWTAAFSPDGKYLITGGDDKIKLWKLKEPIEKFLNADSVDEISLTDKIRLKIVVYKDVAQNIKNEQIPKVAEYFFLAAKSEGDITLRNEYFKNAKDLLVRFRIENTNYEILQGVFNTASALYERTGSKPILDYIKIIKNKFNETEDYLSLKLNYLFCREYSPYDLTDSLQIELGIPQLFLYTAQKILGNTSTGYDFKSIISNDCIYWSNKCVLNKDYSTALQFIKLSIIANENNGLIYRYLPQIMILNNQYKEAEKIYNKWGNKDYTLSTANKTYKEAFIEEIGDLEKDGITHPDFEKAKELLKK